MDSETTGLDPRSHEVIEVGVLIAAFDESGILDVVETFSGLRQPDRPIPTEITRITGITDALVRGRCIDTEELTACLSRADLIVAHNAGFDRPFIERLCPDLGAKAWACSLREIDWEKLGFEGRKLSHLLGQCGWFHDSHRALDDCAALLEVLDTPLPGTDETPFHHLLRSSRETRSRIYALGSPFAAKDELKSRGYRWNDGSDGRPRSWWTDVTEVGVHAELRFLEDKIYGYEVDLPVMRLTAWERYRME